MQHPPPQTPGTLATVPSTATANTNDKDGRGSYKCGRCGVPKKGHVCPYQPKVTRKPGDPVPEMKCVSTQVEMDEFMTLRRLNIEIQGYPESYAAEPMDMVGAEIGQHPISMGAPEPAQPPVASSSEPAGQTSSSSGPTEAAAPSSSQQAGPPAALPSLTSMQSQPVSEEVSSSQKAPEQNEQKPVTNEATSSKVESVESKADETKSEGVTVEKAVDKSEEKKSDAAETPASTVNEEDKPSDTAVKEGEQEAKTEATETKAPEQSSENKPDEISNKKREAEEITTATGEGESVEESGSDNKKQRVE